MLPTRRTDPLAGGVGWFLRETIRLDRAAHRFRTRGRLDLDGEGAVGFPWLRTSHGHQIHALPVAILDGQMGGAHPEEDVSLFPDRLDDGGGIAIPAIRQGHVPRPQRTVPEAFARMLIRDRNRHNLERDPGQTDGQALRGALRPRALDMTPVDDQEPPGCWERGDRMGGQPLRPDGLHPGSTGSHTRRKRRVGHRLIPERTVGGGLPPGLLEAAVYKDHP